MELLYAAQPLSAEPRHAYTVHGLEREVPVAAMVTTSSMCKCAAVLVHAQQLLPLLLLSPASAFVTSPPAGRSMPSPMTHSSRKATATITSMAREMQGGGESAAWRAPLSRLYGGAVSCVSHRSMVLHFQAQVGELYNKYVSYHIIPVFVLCLVAVCMNNESISHVMPRVAASRHTYVHKSKGPYCCECQTNMRCGHFGVSQTQS